MNFKKCLATALLTAAVSAAAEPSKITVDAAHPAHAIPPTLWGIFFEDINLSADGGIYPEMVRNRSFEDSDQPENWNFASVGDGKSAAEVITSDVHAKPPPLNAFNRKSLRITAAGAFTLQNAGYWGMNIQAGEGYTFRVAARGDKYDGQLTVKILSSSGTVLATGQTSGIGGDWKYHTLDLVATGSDPKARLEISGEGTGVFYIDMVSLMPKRTWKNHGLRTDLAQSLDALHPGILRFPGGCWVEGDDFAHMNHWKKTIGNIDVREPLWNIWGYYSTQGLGFHEYLQLAEDLGAEPLFDINCGMSHKETIPMDRMNEWVQDALDAVEYANGPTNSLWGAARARNGHPAPFNLKYMEIGNEDGGPQYIERWPLMVNALRAKYPYLIFISNSDLGGGPYPKVPMPDIVDEHYYESAESFMRRAGQYDKYDRTGPKIFVGEYAVTKNCGLGNLRAAVGEAAFMTGLERNSDQVVMASYAPLLVNLNHRAWNPDLINFDSANWYGLPSYYVQKMFSENRGDTELPVVVKSPEAQTAPESGMIGVATWNTAAEYKDIKVTAPDGTVLFTSDFSAGTQGWKLLGDGAEWKAQDGALRQTAEKEALRAIAGNREWKDYTITLKARKISGAEGFMVMYHIVGDEDRNWWNVGGWGNTADAIEAGSTIDSKPSHIETDRWYDLKLTVSGNNLKCWLDGELIHDVDYQGPEKVASLYSAAATDDKSGDLILKVVNANIDPLETEIDLAGAKLSGQGTATVLASGSGMDENSLAEPMKVSPKTEAVSFSGTNFKRSFPGNSVTVLRLKTTN